MAKEQENNVKIGDDNNTDEKNRGWAEVFAFTNGSREWTPERLQAEIVRYMQFVDGNPLPKDIKVSSRVGGKNGDVDEEAQRTVYRPYNIRTMCARMGIRDWDKFKAKYCNDTTEEGRTFDYLCHQVENYITGSLQEGAVANIYNAKMVMGLTGVSEHIKQEVSSYSDKSDDELQAELERMRKQMAAADGGEE